MTDPENSLIALASVEAPEAPLYFAVSTTKLLVLSLCTFGLYDFYWFYKHWQFVKARERLHITPALWSFFAAFTCYALFRRIRASAAEIGVGWLPAGLLAIAWVFTDLLAWLPTPYGLCVHFAILFLLPVQAVANRVNAVKAPGHNPNAHFSRGNIAVAIIGGLLLIFTVVGTLRFPEQHAWPDLSVDNPWSAAQASVASIVS